MQTIKDRITLFMQHKGFGQAKFAEQAGLSKGFVNTTGDSISTRTINKIKIAFPELNVNWLISGEGEMLKEESKSGDHALSSIGGSVTGGVTGNNIHSGNINGNGNNVGILPTECEKELIRSKAEVDILKRRIKEIEAQHKQEKEILNKMLEQAIIDKDKAMNMLEKALSR